MISSSQNNDKKDDDDDESENEIKPQKLRTWSALTSSNWESAYLKSVFLRLDHHLTWDPQFDIEDDPEIYCKFQEWLFNRQLGIIYRSFKLITKYGIIYTIVLIILVIIMKAWLALIPVVVGHLLLIKFYFIFTKRFNAQYRLREITPFLGSISIKDNNDNINKIETFSEIESADYDEADYIFAKGAVIPFICLSTITTLFDNLFMNAGFLMCFPLAFIIFSIMRSLILTSKDNNIGIKTDVAIFGLLNLGLIIQIFLNSNIMSWDKWLSMCLLFIFGSITMRYYGKIIIQLTRKEFKRKNLMMIERYKTETLFQKVLPPQITQQIRDKNKNNDQDNIIQNVPIHDKNATVAFVKISLFNKLGEKIDDNHQPEIFVNSLHQIVKKFDKIIFLYNGVHKVEHVANTYLLCSGLLDKEIPDNIHPKLTLHACIALKDICTTLRLKNGNFIQITIGIHCGNVVGTVVGAQRRFFRIFGDTVNTASRICSTGIPYKINISQNVYTHCQSIENLSWNLRQNISMKGKGKMNCYVLNDVDGYSSSLDARFKSAQLYSSKSRHSSVPRWMVHGSILVKQNTRQSSTVYINRLQEVTQYLYHQKYTLQFKDNPKINKYAYNHKSVYNHKSAKELEIKFINQQFQKRKISSNWFLFILFVFSLLILSIYTTYNHFNYKNIKEIMFPLSMFIISSLCYLLYTFFNRYQIRQSTELFESLILIISSIICLFCISYFKLHFIHNICLLLLIIFCISFSKLPHILTMIITFLVCLMYIIFFSWQLLEMLPLYFSVIPGIFLLSCWFSYHIEYKLRELFLINLAFEKDQISITKELSVLLPGFVIERMIGGSQQIIDKFNNATIFESDLVGFTRYCSNKKPSQIVKVLNELYMKLDEECIKFGLEKIDTIGDAYICINFTGSPDPVLDFALKLINQIFNNQYQDNQYQDNQYQDNIGIRIGIATGFVIGTVLGESTKRYAIFGDALNRAIKLEEKSNNKQILCCRNTNKRASKLYKFIGHKNNTPTNTAFWLTAKTNNS